MRRLATAALCAALAGGLAACAGVAWPDQARTGGAGIPVQAGAVIGQSLTARDAGLTAVDVFLSPEAMPAGGGQVILSLLPNRQAQTALASTVLPLSAITAPAFHRFDIDTQTGSQRTDYFVQLEVSGPGVVVAGTADGEAYDQGVLYLNGQPQAAQLAFRLVYAPGRLAWGWLWDMGRGLGWALAAAGLYVLPGLALLRWLLPAKADLDWASRVALAAGVGLALPPVWLLWMSVAGWQAGPLHAWLPVLLSAGVLAPGVWQWLRARAGWPRVRWPSLRPESAALASVVALIFAARFWAIRSLDGPMWGDSVQHAFMAQLILDQGGLFQSWQPYTPFVTLTNQFGFSAAAAYLTWLTGAGVVQATLVAGQLLNGIACFTLYPLAVKLARGNRWAGVAAVTVAGLLSSTPAVYVNWGRYAQLTGLAILPAALLLTWEAVERAVGAGPPGPERRPWRPAARMAGTVLAGLAIAGLSLSYYRMAFFVAAFFSLWLVAWALPLWRTRAPLWGAGLGALALTAITATLWAWPWLPRLSRSNLAGFVEAGVTLRPAVVDVMADLGLWRTLPQYHSWWLIAAAAAGLALSLARRQWELASLPLWYLLLAMYAVGSLVGLPVASMLEQFTLVIAAYVPVAILGGWLFAAIVDYLARRWPRAGRWLAAGIIAAAAALGAVSQRGVSQPATQAMLTRPDLNAAAWLKANTPPDAVVLVEGYSSTYASAVGGDAGWWLPLIAQRATTMPPRYALLSEVPADPAYPRQVVELVRAIEAGGVAAPEAVQLMCALNVTHAYVGQRQGVIGANPTQLFSATELEASALFVPVYKEDRVSIFALRAGVCRPT